MLAAVHEIHDQTKGEPDCETHPGLPIQTANQNEAENDRADRRERHARSAEAAVCVRLGLTHPQNACGHDDERRQRTDVHQFEQYVDVDETAGDGRQDAEEPGALVGGTVLRVHFAEELREQAVAAHGVADAGLAV